MFRPRGKQFNRTDSSSSSLDSSGGANSKSGFCGQCGGRHKASQCLGVRGPCNNYGQIRHFARVCPYASGRHSNLSQQGLLDVLHGDRIPLLSPNDQVIIHLKRLGSEGLLNLSSWDLSALM
ncbi:hypothetical protein F511_17350 [Dorcoceras hygrometricum]|uniref:Uncharacterized protein n=1 Tax=Dorcoceras hygrometricum TaxID=472368 RepID=A0A2Z7A5F8_9LAMI|nr:hypothetical protein F511_17350 [Dorcoceras hygrometricum]